MDASLGKPYCSPKKELFILKLIIGASIIFAIFVGMMSYSVNLVSYKKPIPRHHRHHARVRVDCKKLFTVAMGKRAGYLVYAGTKDVSKKELRLLGRIEKCQRNPNAQWFVRWFDHHQARLWWRRRHPVSIWAIPWPIVNCESGGVNLPPNGATASGYYQIVDGTWLSYGGGAYASQAWLASKSAQDKIASRIWAGGSGSSQWVCAGLVSW